MCPHNMFDKHAEMIRCVEYCMENKTLLRYFDLGEILKLIEYLKRSNLIPAQYVADMYFDNDISKIKMNSIKTYYLDLLSRIQERSWPNVRDYVKMSMKRKFDRNKEVKNATTYVDKAKTASYTSGGVLITTADAHTLTDGPTIYLTENIQTIGNFYIQQSSIPKNVFDNIFRKLAENNQVLSRIAKLEDALEDELKGAEMKDKSNKDIDDDMASVRNRIDKQIEALKSQIQVLSLDPVYIPNTVPHQNVWTSPVVENAFVPSIDSQTARRIMELEIDDRLKILLLLGIGSFETTENSFYTEIVKEMAFQKRLFMIIASSDYIYGTNYQFCHEFVGKDLTNMSQQKTIQAIGRVGRNNVQQEYTVRFRDDSIILNLFKQQDHNIEAETMCRLLVTDVDEEEDEAVVVEEEEDVVDEEDEVVCKTGGGLRNEDDETDF